MYGCPQGDLLPVKDQPQEGEEAGYQEGLHEDDISSISPNTLTTTTTTAIIVQ